MFQRRKCGNKNQDLEDEATTEEDTQNKTISGSSSQTLFDSRGRITVSYTRTRSQHQQSGIQRNSKGPTEQQDAPVFTLNQINQLVELVELVTQQVRQETEERYQGRPLPSSIVEELEHCAQTDNLHKTAQKFRKNIPKYVSEDWVTAEAINPNFVLREV
ncbi:hypothetical protein BD408DRAFT_437120 [Parasitella parasitica]|nr:hypothetical protein BD408DRAFT_437120 [Parasitella parasitica]